MSVVLCVFILLTACHREEPDYFAWDHLLESDAPVTVDVARQAFALAFAPLPGVERPPGKVQVIHDGTLALDWMDAFITELTNEQREIFDKLNVEAPLPIGAPLNKTITPEIKGWIDQATAAYLTMTGVTPPKIEPYVSDEYQGTTAMAFARPKDANGKQEGAVVRCRIGLPANFFRFYTGTVDQKLEAHESIAHEVFHCFEYPSFETLAKRDQGAGWILEGAATWASIKLLGSAASYEHPWKLAIEKSGRPLFSRTYDAVGFFFQLEKVGPSPAMQVAKMIKAYATTVGDLRNPAALAAATDGIADFYYRWGTTSFRDPTMGGDWDTYGIGLPATVKPTYIADAFFQTGGALGIGATDAATYEVSADVLVVRSSPDTRLFRSGAVDLRAPFANYCTRPDGCDCPAGSLHEGEIFPPLESGAYRISVAGGSSGSSWIIVGFSKDEYCGADKVDPCLLGGWTLQGSSAMAASTGNCKWDSPIGAQLSISKNGDYVVDLDPIPIVDCSRKPDAIFLKLGGQATGQLSMATRGVVLGDSDLSGLTVGMYINMSPYVELSFSMLFGGGPDLLGGGGGGARYSCSSKRLEWTVGGVVNTYTRP